MMKKALLNLVVLTLCLSMLTSCSGLLDGIAPQATSAIIDSMQSEYEEKGYDVQRGDAESIASLNSPEMREMIQLDLKGEFTDYLICNALDENGQAEFIYAYGLSDVSDGGALEDYFHELYGSDDYYDCEIINMGWVVTVRLSFTMD